MAANPNYKPNEGKREEFRRYLEKTGVMDALTKVLVLLYEEPDKPDDALLFIQNVLAKQRGNETIDELKAANVELQEQIARLEEEKQAKQEPLTPEDGPIVGEAPPPSGEESEVPPPPPEEVPPQQ